MITGFIEVTDASTGVTTRTPIDKPSAVVKAEHLAAVTDEVWADVDAKLDMRAMRAAIALLARSVADIAAGVPVDPVPLQELASDLLTVAAAIETLDDVEARLQAATTHEEVLAVKAAQHPVGIRPDMKTIAAEVRRQR